MQCERVLDAIRIASSAYRTQTESKNSAVQLGQGFLRNRKTASASDLRAINLYRAFTESKNGFGLSDETIAFDIKDLARLYGPQRRSKP
jgi:hypothetical protein